MIAPVYHDIVIVQFTQLQVVSIAMCILLAALLAALLFGCDKNGNMRAK